MALRYDSEVHATSWDAVDLGSGDPKRGVVGFCSMLSPNSQHNSLVNLERSRLLHDGIGLMQSNDTHAFFKRTEQA